MTAKKCIRVVCSILGLLFLSFLAAPFALNHTPLDAMLTCLPFGWWHFLKRNIPQINFNWGLVVTGVVCSLLALLVGNWFISFLFRQIQANLHPDRPVRKWRWSWTICLYACIWIFFLIALGAAGVSQQAKWLIDYDQPWYRVRRFSSELTYADWAIQQLLMDNKQDLERTRKAVLAEYGHWPGAKMLCEDFNIILYGDSSNNVAAYLIIPRDPQLIAKGNFIATVPEGSGLTKPLSQLQPMLSELDAKYSSRANH